MLKFGTDGIRGIIDKELDKETIFSIGKALSKKVKNAKILLAKDNRVSSEYVALLFSSGVISYGGTVTDIGYISTPAVSYTTNNFKCNYAVMISASHNTPEYNGIKIFNSYGTKLNSEEEKELELLMSDKEDSPNNFGKYRVAVNLKKYYIEYLKKIVPFMPDDKIMIDTSNGVTSYYAQGILSLTGAKIFPINNSFDGKIINKDAGILNPDILLKEKNKNKCDYAIALDGDGDRVFIIDKYNNILDGDYILYFLSHYYKKYKKINGVVGTIQTNLGIEKALNSLGINLYRSDVGDKNLIKLMNEKKLILGAEQSGHIIIKDYLNTGDGLLSALIVLGIIKQYEKNGEYLKIFNQIKITPQINLNYSFKNDNILQLKNVQDFIANEQKFNSVNYRIIVRKSGSERKVRITVEGLDKIVAENIATKIYNFISNADL